MNVLKTAITVAAGATFSLTARAVSEKPNIIFILADDLGYHQVGFTGSSFYKTPNIDKLAADGMQFTNAYAACPVCSPTRASLMTGKYPARLHLTNFIPGNKPKKCDVMLRPEWTKYLPLEEVTVAESLKSAGYTTGHFGKWHLNIDKKYKPGREGDPGSQGFDDVLTTHKPGAGPKSKYKEDWHHVREITERATAFIEANKEQPFFCYISHNSVHDRWIEREELIAKYKDKPGADKKGRDNYIQAAMMETMDKSVGTIVAKLDKLGLSDNTLLIFFSDNGQKGPKKGEPFRGSKGDLYEGGVRVPFAAKWPAIIAPNSVCDEVVISNDFFATFNEAAGVTDAGDTDGISLMSLLKDSSAQLDRKVVYWHFPHYHGNGLGPQGSIRMGRYKLVEWFEKSSFGKSGAFELFDLEKDPGERENLYEKMPEQAETLVKQLREWRARVGAQAVTKADPTSISKKKKKK